MLARNLVRATQALALTSVALVLSVVGCSPRSITSPRSGSTRYDNLPAIEDFSPAEAFSLGNGVWTSPSLEFSFGAYSSDISISQQRNAVRNALAQWSAVSSLTFSEATDPTKSELNFLWAALDHGDGDPFDGPDGTLAHAFFPPPNQILPGDVHFDDDEFWTDVNRATTQQPIDLETVALHETGHALGLAHSADPSAVMYPTYYGSHRTLAKDDIQAIQMLYPVSTLSGWLVSYGVTCSPEADAV